MLESPNISSAVFSALISNWYFIPLIILILFLKSYKPKKKYNKKKNTYKKKDTITDIFEALLYKYNSLKNKNPMPQIKEHNNEPELKYKEYRPRNKINSDRGSLYTTIHNEPKPENIVDTKQKGDEYEDYICKHFEEQGYLTVPHGKHNGVKDQGIDIILKKEKEILFIQCKHWNEKNKYKIDHKEIQYVRMNVRDYMEKNKVFGMYNWKILYITSENILDGSANYKIREHSEEIEHKVIPIAI